MFIAIKHSYELIIIYDCKIDSSKIIRVMFSVGRQTQYYDDAILRIAIEVNGLLDK